MRFLVVLLVAIVGCTGLQDTAALGEEFSLRPGEHMTIAGEDVTITLITVTNDSRCPTGVQCIWEGNAEVHVRLVKTGQPEANVVLNTSAQFPSEARYSDYTIRLTGLNPYPAAGSSIPEADYEALLIVTK